LDTIAGPGAGGLKLCQFCELEDSEFSAAIREQREPKSSVAQVLPAMQTLGRLDKQLT